MTATRPDNEAIFHAAREIADPDRRREYVRGACGGDEARIALSRRCWRPPTAQTACWTVRRRPLSGRPSTSLPRRARHGDRPVQVH